VPVSCCVESSSPIANAVASDTAAAAADDDDGGGGGLSSLPAGSLSACDAVVVAPCNDELVSNLQRK